MLWPMFGFITYALGSIHRELAWWSNVLAGGLGQFVLLRQWCFGFGLVRTLKETSKSTVGKICKYCMKVT